MTPHFLHVLSNGQIWISADVNFVPSGTIVQTFRINSIPTSQLVCTLTGSGNSSASALAISGAKKSGKAEGNEIV